MSLRFVIGGSGSGKTRYLYEELIQESIKEPEGRFFAIVPEQFTMQTQKEIVSLHPFHGVMNIDIVSFERLAWRIFEELAVERLAVLDDMGKAMVLRKVAAGVKNDLKLFGGHLDQIGFIGELKSMLSEFFQYGITGERLAELAQEETSPLLRRKLEDMHALYGAFKEYTRERMIAKEELLEILARKLPRSELIKNSVVTLDGYTGFTPVQYKVLELLLTYCRRVSVTVTMDPGDHPYREASIQELFHMSRHTVCRLIDLAAGVGCGREEDVFLDRVPYWRFRESPQLQFIERELFRYRAAQYKPESGGEKAAGTPPQGEPEEPGDGRRQEAERSSLFLWQAAAPGREVELVCGEICRLVREDGLRYRDIAVLTGDLPSYSREIVRQFSENGIPFFIDYKKNIMGNPMVELIRAALDAVRKNFSYESMFRYLKTGLAAPVDERLHVLENYVLALGIRGFAKWNAPWEKTYRGAKHINLLELNELREAILAPLAGLREVFSNKSADVRTKTGGLVHFLEELGVEEKLRDMEAQFHASGEVSLEKEFGQVYGLVMELFDRITALLGGERISRAEYCDILDAGFAEIKVGLIPAVVDQIPVGDITRSRLSHVKALFFVGVNDGVVPCVSGRGGILSEAERNRLKERRVELAPTAREEGFLQRFYLYLALTKPSKALYISFSLASADGKSLRPSSLVGQLLKLFPGKRIETPDIKELAVWSLPLGLRSVTEGMKQYEEKREDKAFLELFSFFRSSKDYGEELRRLGEAVFYSYTDRGIGRTAAKELYSQILRGSVTRMELYASCAYAHFLAYGLELTERPSYELAPADIGNLFHQSIDAYFKRMREEGRSFRTISDEDRTRLVGECVADVAAEYGNTIMKSSARNRYLERKVRRIMDRTIWALTEQLKKGDFEPEGFEVTFTPVDNLRAMKIPISREEAIHLRGRIDRIDLCEDGDLLYLKIIDYKTGKTKFDLTELYHGLQLQLVVYMDAAVEKVQRERPEKRVIPAGIFYYHIDDPMLERGETQLDEDESPDPAGILKKLRMNGLVNADPEALGHLDHRLDFGGTGSVDSSVVPVSLKDDAIVMRRSAVAGEERFAALGAFVNQKMKRMGREILDGRVSVSPYKNGPRTACDFCPYHSVCGFDLKTEGYGFRRLDHPGAEEIWERIVKETKP